MHRKRSPESQNSLVVTKERFWEAGLGNAARREFPRHQPDIKVPALDLGDIRLIELSGNPLGALRGRLCSHIQESLHGRACDLRPVFLTWAMTKARIDKIATIEDLPHVARPIPKDHFGSACRALIDKANRVLKGDTSDRAHCSLQDAQRSRAFR